MSVKCPCTENNTYLVNPPLRAVSSLDRLVAAIQDHNEAKLKLKCIASGKSTVEHVDGMMKGDVLANRGWRPFDPHQSYLPTSLPLIATPDEITALRSSSSHALPPAKRLAR